SYIACCHHHGLSTEDTAPSLADMVAPKRPLTKEVQLPAVPASATSISSSCLYFILPAHKIYYNFIFVAPW
ncbi:hypothetical protein PJI17_31690, partial [Mycobacterium kansasii]